MSMDWLSSIPDGIWQLPTPILGFILIATGVLVTRREHKNMEKLMEYFRTLAEKKDATIEIQTKAIASYREAAETTKTTIETVRDIATERRN